jgi:NAD(P)-dependent dehydrogenase (short-subunit alcohol dehydrogenase family)
MAMQIDLSGQTVLITGGTQGIGRGIAEAFLGVGAHVVVCARRPGRASIKVNGRTAEFRACDVWDADAGSALVRSIGADYGRLDVLVNNAEADERDLVTELQYCRDNSRLSCQVRLSDALDGLRVTVAPEE